MKKNLIAFILVAALLTALSVVGVMTAEASAEDILAVEESMDNFTEVRSYENQFADVPADAWYVSAATKAYSYGLIDGESEDRFNPDGSLSMAAAITMVDRVHSIYYTGTQDFAESEPWYASYVDYARENGILPEAPTDCNDAITRAHFAALLARTLPEKVLLAVSEIEDNSIPDVASNSPYYADFYLLYRAGVLTGSDELGSAWPDDPITRAEAAVVLARMADRNERRSVTLTAAVTMYALDGRTLTVFANEVKINEALGWYRYPVTKIHALDGESKVIPTGEEDTWLEAGWYSYPVMMIYALGGESKVIPSNEKDDWMKSGWYVQPIIPLPPNFNKTTTLPVISISTGGASISRTEDYTNCTVSVFNVGGEQALSNVTGGIRVRGNASRAANPPPYRIKFDKKQNMLGLNNGAETRSWVLLTNVEGAADGMKNDIASQILYSDG